jgi:hypothetical protein
MIRKKACLDLIRARKPALPRHKAEALPENHAQKITPESDAAQLN